MTKALVPICDEYMSIIKHARKSMLFNGNTSWVKRNENAMFDVTMGSYDGAEVCELVGLFISNILAKHLGKSNVGLYRDDGLVIVKGKNG